MKKAIIAVIILAVLVGGAFALMSGSDKTDTPQIETTTPVISPNTDANDTSDSPNTPTSSEVTITYSGNSFSPATLTVKAGTTVTIVNESSSQMQFSSNDHPVHSDNPELNAAAIGAGQSTTITPSSTGTWGYHDHLNESVTGTLVVE